MKYAFIFASNIYLSNYNTVSYADNNQRTEFLKVLSYYKHHNNNQNDVLNIDLNITTSDDQKIVLAGNQPDAGTVISIETDDQRIKLFRSGHEEPVLDIRQLDEKDYKDLSSHIANEIEAQKPDAVFTIRGDFRVDGHRVLTDNEKLFVDGDDYGNGVTNSHEGVLLTPYGVLA